MRIAYLVTHAFGVADGVSKKVTDQVACWRACGHEVRLFAITPTPWYEADRGYPPPSPMQRLAGDVRLERDVVAFEPDVLYCRYALWSRSLQRLFERFRTVVEINTAVPDEWLGRWKRSRSAADLATYAVHRALHGRLFTRAAAFVTVTRELARLSRERYGVPTATVPNGVDLSRFDVLERRPSPRATVFFLGSPDLSWHGVDHLERLAEELPHLDFDVVGYRGEPRANLRFHGRLDEKAYLPLMSASTVCVSSLALYRVGLEEACPLKVREYVARGFPVVLGHEDPAFGSDPPDWVLRLDTRGQLSRSATALNAFVDRVAGRVLTEEERACVSMSRLEAERLDFLRSVAQSHQAGA